MPPPHDTDSAPGADEEDDLTSRSDKKRARRVREDALARLAKDLVALAPKKREKLELPGAVEEAVELAARMPNVKAAGRQLRVVRATLRDADWAKIQSQLETLLRHGTVGGGSPGEAEARRWVVRLLGEGSPALTELLDAHPSADRTHLRQLIKAAQSSAPTRRARAQEKLANTVRFLIERG